MVDMHAPLPVCHRIFGRRPRKYKIMRLVLNDEITVHSTYQQGRFEDASSSPDLKPEASPHSNLKSSKPHHSIPSLKGHLTLVSFLLLHLTLIRMLLPLQLKSQQLQWHRHPEFRHMHEPKIIKFMGGYSADAELVFQSWHTDILVHIQDRELDNKAAIQLIKDQTLESAHHVVEFQLDLCSGDILCQTY